MKKLGAWLLALCLILCMIPATVAFADETAKDDPLLVHYDFSGETLEEALSDKATGGSTKDNLNPYYKAENVGAVAVEEADLGNYFVFDRDAGTVTVTESGAYLRDEKLDDLKKLDGIATFFFRFRLQKLPAKGKFAYLLDLRDKWGNGGRKFQSMLFRINENGALNLLYCDKATGTDANRNIVGQNTIEVGVYYNLAVTMTPNADGSATLVTTYLSTGLPADATAWSTASGVELAIDFSQMAVRESSMAIFSYWYGQPENYGGVTLDDLRIYNACLAQNEVADIVKNGSFDTSGFSVAYQTGGKFVSFYQPNTNYIKCDSGNSWKLKNQEGSLGGTALWCESKAPNAKGDGFTLTFFVPEEGDYTVWGRVYYENNASNSLFYSIDGGAEAIWDFPDEDSSESDCYRSWQYFYMTERKAGTYTDTAKYGTWTIENSQWRHSPAVLHLTAGEHKIHFTGREAGMYLNELVVTSYTAEEYDPNAFEAFGEHTANTDLLESCKFCGTEWKHYCSDIFAQTGVSAAKYFKTVSHPTAIAWTIPQPTKAEEPDPTPDPAPAESEEQSEEQTNAPSAPVSDTDSEPASEPTSEPTSEPDKKGCSSDLSGFGIGAVVLLLGVCGMIVRKKNGVTEK